MDRFIASFASVEDEDLRLCESRGVAYQADMSRKIEYGVAYFDHYAALEGSDIAVRLNAGRCAMLARHVIPEGSVLDIGAGCGTFVKAARSWGYAAKGFDVIDKTVEVLKGMDAYAENPSGFDAVTFWDSLEHIEDPGELLAQIEKGTVALVAIPVVSDLRRIRESKHYKPGEHLVYFTACGFVDWMQLHGFKLLEISMHETNAGRESIAAFAFRKVADAQTLACPCGGETFVDSFDWPGKPRNWFLRCVTCRGMSESTATEAEARALTVKPEKTEEAA
jgi:hypothetical protein